MEKKYIVFRVLGKTEESIDNVVANEFFPHQNEGKIRYLVIPCLIFNGPPRDVTAYVTETHDNNWFKIFYKGVDMLSIVGVNDVGIVGYIEQTTPFVVHRNQFFGMPDDFLNCDVRKQKVYTSRLQNIYDHPISKANNFLDASYSVKRLMTMNRFFPVDIIPILQTAGKAPKDVLTYLADCPSIMPPPDVSSSTPPSPL